MSKAARILSINEDRREVFVRNLRVHLAPKEYNVLVILYKSRIAWTRERLLKAMWNEPNSFAVNTRTVDQHCARLRRKLHVALVGLKGRNDSAPKEVIETVANYGYRIAPGIV